MLLGGQREEAVRPPTATEGAALGAWARGCFSPRAGVPGEGLWVNCCDHCCLSPFAVLFLSQDLLMGVSFCSLYDRAWDDSMVYFISLIVSLAFNGGAIPPALPSFLAMHMCYKSPSSQR